MSYPKEGKAYILAHPPVGPIKPDTFKLVTKPLPEKSNLKAGEVVLKTVALSNEPAQRIWMDGQIDPRRNYTTPVKQGEIVRSLAIGEVVASNSKKWKEGQVVHGYDFGWFDYGVIHEDQVVAETIKIEGQSPYLSIGTVGLTGLTAYVGAYEICKLKKEHTIVISGAAGAVGSILVQIAKKIIGCERVIGIAGGPEKCKWVKSLGADECVDYKAGNLKQDLTNLLPDYADVYFDNVGGEALDVMLALVKRHGFVGVCGGISAYNATDPLKLANWSEIVYNRLNVQGFIFSDKAAVFPKAIEDMTTWIKEGKIDISEGEMVVEAKLEDVPQVWHRLFEGGNRGKLITKLVS